MRTRWLSLTVSLLISVSSATAQQTAPREDWEEFADSRPFPTDDMRIPQWRLTDGRYVRLAFRDVIEEARLATVRVRTDGRDTALGGIVGADGWIITKASRLPGEISCVLTDQRELDARIVGVDRDYDIAMLKIDAQQLPTLKLEAMPVPDIGAWLATMGMNRGPQAVGVLSVEAREIMHRAGVLGVRFGDDSQEPVIVEVFEDTAASRAGLLPEDRILSINGQPINSRITFVRRVREYSPGDRVSMRIEREEEELSIKVLLQGRRPWRLPTREEFQNQLGSKLSKRRFGFPQAFQHDTVLKPSDCGGPVVNLDGEVVGFNLARAGRTETYAIPTSALLEVMQDLKVGATQVSEAR
ncbi:MAG: S1C family serine protease [Bythopirellula sp.]